MNSACSFFTNKIVKFNYIWKLSFLGDARIRTRWAASIVETAFLCSAQNEKQLMSLNPANTQDRG